MSEMLVWKLKEQLKLVRIKKSERGLSCVCAHEHVRQNRAPCCFLFQATLSKNSLQGADRVVVLLLVSDLSYEDAEKPSVHHTEIAACQTYTEQNKGKN